MAAALASLTASLASDVNLSISDPDPAPPLPLYVVGEGVLEKDDVILEGGGGGVEDCDCCRCCSFVVTDPERLKCESLKDEARLIMFVMVALALS